MILTVIALAVVVATLFAVDISMGEYRIPLEQTLRVLGGGGTQGQQFIILQTRLPQAVTAVAAGAALGLAGALTQSILRNPLASPDVLGITAGASCAAVAALAGTGGVATGAAAALGVPLAALAGGLLTAVAIYLLAWGRTTGGFGVTGIRLVLIGIGLNAMLMALVGWQLARASQNDAARAQLWLTGSLANADWSRALPAAAGLAIVVPVAIGSARTLAALRFDADSARALGVGVQAAQARLLVAAVAGAALATAAVGPLAFVGLAAPQVARRLLRCPGEPLLASALTGAVVVLGADVATRTLAPALPAGVLTAVLGAPVLLLLLVRTHRWPVSRR
jgi:iron complex transport system permease protein